jgi:hypothetical protein
MMEIIPSIYMGIVLGCTFSPPYSPCRCQSTMVAWAVVMDVTLANPSITQIRSIATQCSSPHTPTWSSASLLTIVSFCATWQLGSVHELTN